MVKVQDSRVLRGGKAGDDSDCGDGEEHDDC